MNENENNGFINNQNMNNMNGMNNMNCMNNDNNSVNNMNNGMNNMNGMNNTYPQKENNLGKISLVMAYASWMLCCFGPLLSIPAFIIAIMALVRKSNESKLFPILAILGSILDIVLSVVYFIITVGAYAGIKGGL